MQPEASASSLDDIIDFFSRFAHLYQNAPLRFHKDGLIETPIGCFRLALSESRQCTALFYARHPEDLATCDEDGHLRFLYPDRMLMLGTHKIHRKPEREDGKLRFDIGWVLPIIHDVVYSLPRILLREANLFRLGNNHRSQYVSYQPVPVDGEDSNVLNINLFTNPHMTYNLAAVETTVPATGKYRRFRRFLEFLTSSRFVLKVKKEAEDGEPHVVELFEKKNVSTAILADFHKRAELAWSGQHPVGWDEKRNLPVFRVSSNIRWEFKNFIEHMSNKEHAARWMGKNAAVFGLSFVIPGAGYQMWIYRLAEWGLPFKHPRVRKEIHPVVKKHLRRLAGMRSDLNRMLLGCDAKQWGDFEALHPKKHVFNFLPADTQYVRPNPRREFGSWVKRHFFSSYVASWRFYTPDALLTDTKNFAEAVVVKQSISNGMKIFLLPKTMEMFAYFSDDGFEVKNRKFPSDTPKYFKPGKVLHFNLKDKSDRFTEMDFAAFEKRIQRLTKAPTLEIQPAQSVPGDRINHAMPHARGVDHPLNLAAPFPDIFPT